MTPQTMIGWSLMTGCCRLVNLAPGLNCSWFSAIHKQRRQMERRAADMTSDTHDELRRRIAVLERQVAELRADHDTSTWRQYASKRICDCERTLQEMTKWRGDLVKWLKAKVT